MSVEDESENTVGPLQIKVCCCQKDYCNEASDEDLMEVQPRNRAYQVFWILRLFWERVVCAGIEERR